MTDVFKTSASAIEDFMLCERKLAFRRAGLGESNRFAAEGTEVHEELDAWRKDRVLPRNPLALALLKHFPIADHVAKAEGGTDVLDGEQLLEVARGDVVFKLKMDLTWVDVGPLAERWGRKRLRVVRDWKTTSSFDYAKGREDLLSDVQATTYGYAADKLFGGAASFETLLSWAYVEKKNRKNPKTLVTEVLIDRAHTEAAMVAIVDPVVARMRRRVEEWGPDPLAAEPNARACGAFGGCPHVERCSLSAAERMRSHVANDFFKKQLEENKRKLAEASATRLPQAEAKPEAPTSAPAAKPAAAAPLKAGQVLSFKDRARALAAGRPAVNPPDAPKVSETENEVEPPADPVEAAGLAPKPEPKKVRAPSAKKGDLGKVEAPAAPAVERALADVAKAAKVEVLHDSGTVVEAEALEYLRSVVRDSTKHDPNAFAAAKAILEFGAARRK